MAKQLWPTTELEAVNAMLQTIGETPVNSLEDTGLADAVIAHSLLQRISQEVQAKGWHFNTEISYPLVPNNPTPGDIELPGNVLYVDMTQQDADMDVVQRGFRLYDRRNHTYKFSETLHANMVVFLDFTELPEPARQYIYVRAARAFQDQMLGSQVLHTFSQQDEDQMWAALCAVEGETQDHNVLTDNYHAYPIVHRQGRKPIKL
jgi:hypothetical protein